jgi:hypothetical protein
MQHSPTQAYSGTTVLPGLEFGWAPPTRNVEVTKSQEDETFLELNRLSQLIESCNAKEARQSWESERDRFHAARAGLQQERSEQRAHRKSLRAASDVGAALRRELNLESCRLEGEYRRKIAVLKAPFVEAKAHYDAVIAQRLVLKRKRRDLSKSLQAAFMAQHVLTNFRHRNLLIEVKF